MCGGGDVDKAVVRKGKKKSLIFLASGFIVKVDSEKIQVKGQNLGVLNEGIGPHSFRGGKRVQEKQNLII